MFKNRGDTRRESAKDNNLNDYRFTHNGRGKGTFHARTATARGGKKMSNMAVSTGATLEIMFERE